MSKQITEVEFGMNVHEDEKVFESGCGYTLYAKDAFGLKFYYLSDFDENTTNYFELSADEAFSVLAAWHKYMVTEDKQSFWDDIQTVTLDIIERKEHPHHQLANKLEGLFDMSDDPRSKLEDLFDIKPNSKLVNLEGLF